jgi:hypothetical protein
MMKNFQTRTIRTVLCIAGALGLMACGSAGDVKVLGSDGSSSPSTTTEPAPRAESEAEEKARKLELTVESGMTSATNSIGVRSTSAGALVTNPNVGLAAYDVDVLFNLTDENGVVLDSSGERVEYIAPGATVPVAPLLLGYDLATEPASLEVVVTGDLAEDKGWAGVRFSMHDGIELEMTGAALFADRYRTSLTAQVRNPSDDTVASLSTWDCVFRNGGTIVGGEASAISERIPPGVTVAVDSMVTTDVTADEIICLAIA